jgi:hypothetical protein
MSDLSSDMSTGWQYALGCAQISEGSGKLRYRLLGGGSAQTAIEFGVEGGRSLNHQAPTCRGQLEQAGPTVIRVRPPPAVAAGLDTVDQLAGTAGRDAELGGDVVHPAGAEPVHDRHGLEVRQRQASLRLQPGVDRVPQLDLQADQVVEQLP